MEPTKLHFTRVRAKGEPVFFDPATDIRKLLPAVSKATVMLLQDVFKDDKNAVSDFLYLHKCFCIMQIRLSEDAAPCEEQMRLFFAAVNKVPKKHLFLWLQATMALMTSMYGLFYRRDAKADKEALKAMTGTSQLVALSSFIGEETLKKVREEAAASKKLYDDNESFDDNGFVVCDETGDVITGIKDLAGLFLDHSGDGSWKALAAACDDAFDTMETADTRSAIALGLAYPDYDSGSLTLEVTE